MSSSPSNRSKSLESLQEDKGSQFKHRRGHQEFDWLATPRKNKKERIDSQPAEGDRIQVPEAGTSEPSSLKLSDIEEEDFHSIIPDTGYTFVRTQSLILTPTTSGNQQRADSISTLDRQSHLDLESTQAQTSRALKHLRFDKELIWEITPRKVKKGKLQRSESLELVTISQAKTGDYNQETQEETEVSQAAAGDSPTLPTDEVSAEWENEQARELAFPTEADTAYISSKQQKRPSKGFLARMFGRKDKKDRPSSAENQGKLYQAQATKRKLEYDTVSLPDPTIVEMQHQPMAEQGQSGSQPFTMIPLSQLYLEKGKISGPELATYAEYAKLILESNSAHHKAFLRDYLSTLQEIEIEKARSRPLGVTELDRELVNLPRSSHTTIKMNELVLKPEVFNGDKPKPRRWLTDYSEAIIANGWSDHLAVKYLPTFLSRAAKDWYFTEVRPRLTPDTKWSHVHEMFTNNYLGEADYVELSRAIEKASQRPDEKTANFIPRLRRLLQMLSPDMNETEMVRKLKEKLRPEYRQLVNLQPSKTIAELKDVCARIESGFPERNTGEPASRERNKIHRGGHSRVGPPERLGHLKPAEKSRVNDTPPRRKMVRASTARPTQYGKPRTDDKAITCYNCNKIGHISRDCLAPRKARTGSKPVNAIEGNHEEVYDTSQIVVMPHGHSKPKTVATIKPAVIAIVGNCNYVYKDFLCNGTKVRAAIDSGAKISVVRADVVKENGWDVNGPVIPLHGADGKLMEAQRSIYLDVEMSTNRFTKKKKHLFAIMAKLTEPMLIGRDLLQSLGIVIDHATDSFSFSKMSLKSGVRTSSHEVVPARSQAVIAAKVNTVGTILVKPFMEVKGVRIANAITEVVDNQISLLALNPTNTTVKLEPGLQLGSYEAIEEATEVADSNFFEPRDINQVICLEDTSEVIQAGDQLSSKQIDQLRIVIEANREIFSLYGELGKTQVFKHSIELLPGASPFAEPLRRRAQVQIDETRKQVKEMLEQGIIEESSSPWASAYVLAKKKNGEYRLCIDFRKLNAVTKKTVYPLPNIDECLDTLSGKQYFTQLDFKSGFWQIPMEAKSKELTAFRTEDGLFHFNRMPFGLTNAPASFQKMINIVLAGLKGLNLQVFIDDVCLATKTWEEHLTLLETTFKVIKKANLKVKADKCVFGASKITFLGHEISREGIRQDPQKLRALDKLPSPTDAKEVKQALGMFSYYRKFVENFASLAEPMTRLTRKGVKFSWGEEQQAAFQTIISKLKANGTLAHFNHSDPTMVKTDASKKGVAGMLLQHQDGDWKIVTCCSRRLTASETNYGITDLEGLAVIYTVQKLRPYLLGKPFKILVDHCALCVLNKREPVSARLKRWAIVLSEFDFEIVYTKGKLHSDIDCLSRAPVDDPIDPYLDNKVYMIIPYNRVDWLSQYRDEESKSMFTKAVEAQENLRLVDDVIYHKDQLYVPQTKRHEIVHAAHSSNMNAHPGIRGTLAKLVDNYWWPKMYESVEQVIKTCSKCIMNKPERARPAGVAYPHEVYEAGKQIAIDCLGPLTESVNGNLHVIVAIDMFTRFVEAKAVSEISAPSFVQFFLEYCGRFGVPHSILTDNASTFSNSFVEEVRKVLGASHLKATPRHSQGNAVVERVIQVLQEKLRLCLDDPLHESNWDAVLPIAVLAINTTYHSSVGYSPYEMTYGRKPPVQDKNITLQSSPHDMFAKLIKLQLREYHANAVAVMSSAQDRSKSYYDDRRRERLFAVGDKVVYKAPDRRSKLADKFVGPCEIVNAERDIYTLIDTKTGKKYKRHVADIKPFNTMSLITIGLVLCLASLVSGEKEMVFNKMKPIVWLPTKSQVELGTVEYDIHFAYTNPCHLFESNVKSDLAYGESLTDDQLMSLQTFNSSCNGLYIMEWLQEVTQLVSVKLPSHPLDFRLSPDRPYDENPRERRHVDIEVPLDEQLLELEEEERITRNQLLSIIGLVQNIGSDDPIVYRLRSLTANLTRLWHEIENYSSLDWYLLRIESEGILNDTYEGSNRLMIKRASLSDYPDPEADHIRDYGLPSDYTFWDIAQMCTFFWTAPAITERAQIRTYEDRIKEIQDEIRELISEPKTLQYTQGLLKEDVVKHLHPLVRPKLPSLMRASEEQVRDLVKQLFDLQERTRNHHRSKRGILSNIAGQALQQAVGVFTGNIVSNLISYAIEIINPYSNTNRLGRLEAAYKDMQTNFEVQRQLDRGILENVDKLSNVVQQTVHRLNEHVRRFPQFTWLSSLIVNKIAQAALDLQRVTDEAHKGRLAIEPFVRLTGLTTLKEIESENTRFMSVSKINDHTLNFKFLATIESPDTTAYEVFAFPHWDNLDEVPRYLEYIGEKYLIYNSTSNCIKALPSIPQHIVDQCLELDGTDPALAQWKVSRQTERIEDFANISVVYKTMQSNLIYCFPGRIEIDGTKYTCPFEPFELPPNRGFKTAQQRHVPSRYAASVNQTSYAISAVHAGHYPADSDAIQHLSMFEKLREERRKNQELYEQLEQRVPIVKGGAMFWSVLSFSVGSLVGAVVYCVVIYKLKARIEKLRAPKPSPRAPQQPPTAPVRLYRPSSKEYISLAETVMIN